MIGFVILLLIVTEPASPPRNVTVVNITSTSILLIWEEVPAIDQNGVITQYEVEYNQSTFDSVPTTQNIIVNSTMTVLTGLEEYVDYSIQVRAYTSVGSGPYSDVVMERTEENGKFQTIHAIEWVKMHCILLFL